MRHRRNLLITFDAFGTLFEPRKPIAAQYAEVARAHNLSGFGDEDVGRAFKNAFKEQSKIAPNYGRETGIGAGRWWEQVIRNTFRPFIPPSTPLSDKMVSELMHRFSSAAGYRLHSDVLPFFRHLRSLKTGHEPSHDWPWHRTTVGIISNSDDRICSVLHSLGILVTPRRIGLFDNHEHEDMSEPEDISFVVCSYDAGVEKPDGRIFAVAAHMAARLGLGKDAKLLHVGDDVKKDVVGAERAGWHAVLLDREQKIADGSEAVESYSGPRIGDLRELWKWSPS